jgi:transcriptional regulator GlxA family with amidase domain
MEGAWNGSVAETVRIHKEDGSAPEPTHEDLVFDAAAGMVDPAARSVDDPGLRVVPSPADPQDAVVLRVQGILRSRHHESLSIYALARDLGLTVRILNQRFRRSIGYSVESYLMKMRIDATVQLIRSRCAVVQTETFNC